MFKVKGREVIKVGFDWKLEDLFQFMQKNWDYTVYGEFKIGRPTPASIEEYVCLPATQNCLVIAYTRKGKIIFSVADNSNGLIRLTASALPKRSPIAGIYQSSLSISRAKEFSGPAADICTEYANYMKELLKSAGLA